MSKRAMPSFRGFTDFDFELYTKSKVGRKKFNPDRLILKKKLELLGEDLKPLLRERGIPLPYGVRPNWIDPRYGRSVIDAMWLSFADFKRKRKPPRMLPQLEITVARRGVYATLDVNQKARKYQRRFANYIISHSPDFGNRFADLPKIPGAEFYLPDQELLHKIGSPISEADALKVAKSFQVGKRWLWMGYFLPRSSNIVHSQDFADLAANMLKGLYPFYRMCYAGPDRISRSKGMGRTQTPEDLPEDYDDPPKSQEYKVIRKIRDNDRSKALKLRYRYKCQVCGVAIGEDEVGYAEVHHLRPLGGRHRGLDNWNNMLVLCPNHHVQFGYGWAAVDPNDMTLLHVRHDDKYLGTRLKFDDSHRISRWNLTYHLREVYKG